MYEMEIKGDFKIELSKDQLIDAIVNNFNEDEVFDAMAIAVKKSKMLKSNIAERFVHDYSGEISSLLKKFFNDRPEVILELSSSDRESIQDEFEDWMMNTEIYLNF